MAAAAAAAACGLSVAQLAKLEALDESEAARLDALLRTYSDTHTAQRVPRAQRGEGDSRSCVLQRLASYPRLLKARTRVRDVLNCCKAAQRGAHHF
jgi:hypothetical protein